MMLFRLTRLKYAQDLSGYGASLSSTNRWNSKGNSVLYTASNRALAFAEILPHLDLSEIPKDYVMLTLRVPDDVVIVDVNLLENIREIPIKKTQQLGDEFLKNKFQFATRVPSAVVPGEFNVLINPSHPLADRLIIEDVQPLQFDSRFTS